MKHASKVLVFGGLKNHRTLVRFSSTHGIVHAGLRGFRAFLARKKVGVN
jgi:hypothetical protein